MEGVEAEVQGNLLECTTILSMIHLLITTMVNLLQQIQGSACTTLVIKLRIMVSIEMVRQQVQKEYLLISELATKLLRQTQDPVLMKSTSVAATSSLLQTA